MKTTSENIYLVSRVIALERVNNELTQRQLTIQAESDAAVGKLLAELKIFNDYKALADELIDEQAGLIAEAQIQRHRKRHLVRFQRIEHLQAERQSAIAQLSQDLTSTADQRISDLQKQIANMVLQIEQLKHRGVVNTAERPSFGDNKISQNLSSLGKRFGLAFKKKLQFAAPERAALLFAKSDTKPQRAKRSKTFQPQRRSSLETKQKRPNSAIHLKVKNAPYPEPFVASEVKTGRQELMEQAISLFRIKSDLQDKRIAQLELSILRQSVAFESARQQLEFFICENQELKQKFEEQLWGWRQQMHDLGRDGDQDEGSDLTDQLSFSKVDDEIEHMVVDERIPSPSRSHVIADFERGGSPTLSFRLEDYTISRPNNQSLMEVRESPSLRRDETFDTNEQSTKNAAKKQLTIEIPEPDYSDSADE